MNIAKERNRGLIEYYVDKHAQYKSIPEIVSTLAACLGMNLIDLYEVMAEIRPEDGEEIKTNLERLKEFYE